MKKKSEEEKDIQENEEDDHEPAKEEEGPDDDVDDMKKKLAPLQNPFNKKEGEPIPLVNLWKAKEKGSKELNKPEEKK